jgi:hypothetical protein
MAWKSDESCGECEGRGGMGCEGCGIEAKIARAKRAVRAGAGMVADLENAPKVAKDRLLPAALNNLAGYRASLAALMALNGGAS